MTNPDQAPMTSGAGGSATLGQIVLDYARTIISVVLLVTLFRTFLFESFVIPSGSMIPTLQVGDYIMVSKYSYGYSRFSFPFSPNLFQGRVWGAVPHRGDVAVFRFTKDTSLDYVKRVIGLPGDHIRVTEGQLYLNDQPVPCLDPHPYTAVDETRDPEKGTVCAEQLPASGGGGVVVHPMLRLEDDSGFQNNTPDYVVPPGYFFAMGDNRDNSADSRYMGDGPKDLGFVPMENLVGHAQCVFFSVDSAHPFWQVWYWPVEIRWSRLFRSIG